MARGEGAAVDREDGGAAPLRLFWWNGKPNFGDALSADVVAMMSGRPVEHASPARAELFAVGSILKTVRNKYAEPRADGHRPWVWGSGFQAPIRRDFVEHVEIALLRGPVSAALLGLTGVKFGDPGLVTDLVFDAPERTDRIGVVPHHLQFASGEADAILAQDPALLLIDVRDGPDKVCRQIASCAAVYSASLHGLIVADAYGVPNTWISPGGHRRLKYLDYAASIGRDMPAPLAPEEIGAHMRRPVPERLPYADGIARARNDIMASFPEPLKAAPETRIALEKGKTHA